VIVFWPRVVSPRGAPADSALHELAGKLQQSLVTTVEKGLPGAHVEVRPEPERVCPRSGCAAMTVGAVLTRSRSGCAAVALVTSAGASPSRIVPWAGRIRLRRQTAEFREPPEQYVAVTDYVHATSS